MLLHKEVEGVLQVLVAVYKDLIVLIKVVHEILHKEEVISVKRRELDRSKVSTMRLSVMI